MLTASGNIVFLHSDQLLLIGQGVIGPGAPPATQRRQVLRYTCTSSRLCMADEQ